MKNEIEACLLYTSLKDKTTEETAGADVTSFRFNLSDGTSSVSYTHLDVYKRQGIMNTPENSRTANDARIKSEKNGTDTRTQKNRRHYAACQS